MSTKPKSRENAGVKPKVDREELYYIMHDGKGMPHKVANMDNPLVCRRKGKIQIEAIRRGNHKQPNISICTTFDASNRIIYGIPTGLDEKDKIIWKRFYLADFKEYDLSDQSQAEEWAIVKHHEVLNGARPTYKIYDTEQIAQDEIAQITLIEQAVGIAKDMKLNDWIPCARFFGKQPEGMSPLTLQSEIMKIARDTPNEIIDYWNQENRQVVDIFNAAQAVGIISHDFVKGWLYKKTLPLGTTKELAIRSLIKDATFCKKIQEEVKSLDVVSETITDGKRSKTTFETPEDNKTLFDLKVSAKLLNIKGFEKMTEDQLRERVKDAKDLVLDIGDSDEN